MHDREWRKHRRKIDGSEMKMIAMLVFHITHIHTYAKLALWTESQSRLFAFIFCLFATKCLQIIRAAKKNRDAQMRRRFQ